MVVASGLGAGKAEEAMLEDVVVEEVAAAESILRQAIAHSHLGLWCSQPQAAR